MLACLNAENAWHEQHAKRYQGIEEKLFNEIRGRIKRDDASVPYKQRDYFDYTRFKEGSQWPLRKREHRLWSPINCCC
jgi:oligopeptidase B